MKKKNTVFEEALLTITKYFAVLVVVVVALICFSGLRIVKSGESAIILRFGKVVGNSYEEQVHGSGLLFAFPYIIDEIVTVPTGSVMEQTVTTHYTSGNMTTLHNNGYVITGDQNIAVMSVSVKYNITNAVDYALHIGDIKKIINAAVSNAMVESAAHVSVDSILTSGKEDFAYEVKVRAQEKLTFAEAGVTLSTVELTNVSMPAEVKETYEQVNSASVQAATMIEQANQYRNNIIPQAEATAAKLIASASGTRSTAIAEANADLYEFYGLLEEYQGNADVVRVRLYTAKISEAVARIGKIRVVYDGDSKIFLN